MTENNTPLPGGQRGSSRRPYRPGSRVFIVVESNCIRVFLGEKFFGEIRGNSLTKRICGSRHMLHKPPSIANDLEALHAASDLGARNITVIDTETGKIYRSPLSQIFARGVTFDRGFGRQIRLGLEFWSRGDEPFAEQLSLGV